VDRDVDHAESVRRAAFRNGVVHDVHAGPINTAQGFAERRLLRFFTENEANLLDGVSASVKASVVGRVLGQRVNCASSGFPAASSSAVAVLDGPTGPPAGAPKVRPRSRKVRTGSL
jgi:hypothetical protein